MLLINNLLRHNKALEERLRDALSGALDSGWYILGSQVAAFEEEFARYCQVGRCVSVANGTDALELALRTLGVGVGDKIVTVANAGATASPRSSPAARSPSSPTSVRTA